MGLVVDVGLHYKQKDGGGAAVGFGGGSENVLLCWSEIEWYLASTTSGGPPEPMWVCYSTFFSVGIHDSTFMPKQDC